MAKGISLQKMLEDADERVKKAAADALNEAAEKLEKEIRKNMADQDIKEDTGKLKASIGFNRATTDKLSIMLKSEVFDKAPKNPGRDNPDMKNRYRYGVPYGRIIEFGRHAKPFFYTAWYDNREKIKEEVMEKIGNAWSGN